MQCSLAVERLPDRTSLLPAGHVCPQLSLPVDDQLAAHVDRHLVDLPVHRASAIRSDRATGRAKQAEDRQFWVVAHEWSVAM